MRRDTPAAISFIPQETEKLHCAGVYTSRPHVLVELEKSC